MRKQLLTGFIVLAAVLSLQAQKTLMAENPAVDSTDEKFGPNLRHFVHPVYSYGMFIGDQPATAKINTGSSYYLKAGLLYKYKVSQYYAWGFGASISNSTFSLKQQSSKALPDTIRHKKERLNWMNLNVCLYNRFNFNKRGNVIGAYTDIGVQGGYTVSYNHFTFDKNDEGLAVRTRTRGHKYYNPFYYEAFVHLGYDRLSLNASYRFSNLFKSKYSYPELPRFCLALTVAIY